MRALTMPGTGRRNADAVVLIVCGRKVFACRRRYARGRQPPLGFTILPRRERTDTGAKARSDLPALARQLSRQKPPDLSIAG